MSTKDFSQKFKFNNFAKGPPKQLGARKPKFTFQPKPERKPVLQKLARPKSSAAIGSHKVSQSIDFGTKRMSPHYEKQANHTPATKPDYRAVTPQDFKSSNLTELNIGNHLNSE